MTASTGVFTTPMHEDADGVWRGTLMPPPAVATVVLEVTVGAQKLKVRPRIYVRRGAGGLGSDQIDYPAALRCGLLATA